MLSFSFSRKHLLSLKKINDLENLVQLEKIDFDIIAISESRLIKQDKLPQTNISLTNYHYE